MSIAWGMYFVNSAAHAASGDVTIAWSGVRTAVASPSTSVATPPPNLRALSTRPRPPRPRPRPPSSSPPFHSPRRPNVAPNRAGDTRGVLPPRSAHHVHRVVDGSWTSAPPRCRRRRRRRRHLEDALLDSTPATTTASRRFPDGATPYTLAFAVSTALGAGACVGVGVDHRARAHARRHVVHQAGRRPDNEVRGSSP